MRKIYSKSCLFQFKIIFNKRNFSFDSFYNFCNDIRQKPDANVCGNFKQNKKFADSHINVVLQRPKLKNNNIIGMKERLFELQAAVDSKKINPIVVQRTKSNGTTYFTEGFEIFLDIPPLSKEGFTLQDYLTHAIFSLEVIVLHFERIFNKLNPNSLHNYTMSNQAHMLPCEILPTSWNGKNLNISNENFLFDIRKYTFTKYYFDVVSFHINFLKLRNDCLHLGYDIPFIPFSYEGALIMSQIDKALSNYPFRSAHSTKWKNHIFPSTTTPPSAFSKYIREDGRELINNNEIFLGNLLFNMAKKKKNMLLWIQIIPII